MSISVKYWVGKKKFLRYDELSKGVNFMDDQKTYVCLGTCQGVVTQEQFKNGLNKCGTKGCNLEGHPLIPGKKNPETGKNEATTTAE